MKLHAFIVCVAALAPGGCKKETPENTPVTQVNAPRPRTVTEPTNELSVPVTNLPRTTMVTNK
jgi:hypothetical protein